MEIHNEQHPNAGQTVSTKYGPVQIADWWDRLSGEGWGESVGERVCVEYAMRIAMSDEILPDDEVVLVSYKDDKIAWDALLHNTEIGEVITA